MPGPYLGRPGESDKGINGYLPTYKGLAATLRTDATICELGVYEGGSLKLWQQMFPLAAMIIGVDINEGATWPAGTIKVVADQQDPSLPKTLLWHLSSALRRDFDLIVDDASHLGHYTFKSFQHLWPLVAPGGYYVIEDWLVGFPLYENFDDSMLTLAMTLLTNFDPAKTTDIHFITYQPGLIVLRKKDQ
jgi:hypothetical protein